MVISQSLSNLDSQNSQKMQVQTTDVRLANFLAKKFRLSRSHATKKSYETGLRKFTGFIDNRFSLTLDRLVLQVKEKHVDPIQVLDDYYSYLSSFQRDGYSKAGYSRSTIKLYLTSAKEFLNSEGCRIYNEDIKQRFRLPRSNSVYEKGLTKQIINRLIRLSNAKLATVILIACSSGMRISEIIQLKLSDINFGTNPITVTIRSETTKTRQTRITCLTTEATLALKDYLKQYLGLQENDKVERYLFLNTHEEKISNIETKLAGNSHQNALFLGQDKKRLVYLKQQCELLDNEERYFKSVNSARNTLENQLRKIIESIPELHLKNENGRNSIHFHSFRAWFKTQVTDAHQSDFAEALMGHTSLKLVYYRQNEEARAKTYLGIEHALTISDTTKIDREHDELRQENRDLKLIVDSLSVQLKSLERKIREKF
ncbi:MAG TPA: tyrosine-type recombinase/integrase [Nitrosopumilaceae archaeon]|nr:tyrosine-type recombinase/integrase [Nitrosopumilaceae archaeon]